MIHKTSGGTSTTCSSQSTAKSYYSLYSAGVEVAAQTGYSRAKASIAIRPKHSIVVGAGTIDYENGKQRMNACTHVKDTFEYLDHACWAVLYPPASPPAGSYLCYSGGGPYTKPYKLSTPSLPPITEDMEIRAWLGIIPRLEEAVSLANFLWELKDLPRLAAEAIKCLRHLGSIARLVGGLSKINSKTLAEITLTWSYAVKPFYMDIMSIIDAVGTAERRINDFIAQGKKVKAYHYTEDLGTVTLPPTTAPGGASRYNRATSSVFHGTLWASYHYEKPPFWAGIRKVYGLNPTPQVIWNAIPFSFLVDYLFNVSKILGQLQSDQYLTLYVHGYCLSMKTEAVITEERTFSSSWQSNAIKKLEGESLIWRWKSSNYARTPKVPLVGVAMPRWDGISLRELVLTGALARANF